MRVQPNGSRISRINKAVTCTSRSAVDNFSVRHAPDLTRPSPPTPRRESVELDVHPRQVLGNPANFLFVEAAVETESRHDDEDTSVRPAREQAPRLVRKLVHLVGAPHVLAALAVHDRAVLAPLLRLVLPEPHRQRRPRHPLPVSHQACPRAWNLSLNDTQPVPKPSLTPPSSTTRTASGYERTHSPHPPHQTTSRSATPRHSECSRAEKSAHGRPNRSTSHGTRSVTSTPADVVSEAR